MEFRPCIDIHNGKVKQIVGSTLTGANHEIVSNFVSEQDAPFYARLYAARKAKNGHVILLDRYGTNEYEESRVQALAALHAYPGGLQVGGGIMPNNAEQFLNAGASHVIVTSYVFRDGLIDYGRLTELLRAVGRERLVLDLSCRKKDDRYYIVTDRWQKYTDTALTNRTLEELSSYCDEFLVHAVDVEGKANGIDGDLVALLSRIAKKIPVTYAGGVHTFEDLELLKKLGQSRVNVTIGSALDLFGGIMSFDRVLEFTSRP
ncbi:MAG: phosphoribosylformimino-5-aminoimidazole carboxamide ribotide isomerase [Lachnospiraceae bacterium]|nr:phosphoribosylformimino-5-aminoimidazole carboxamide ribotide isomerase [Lachnospiraceae bacterium]